MKHLFRLSRSFFNRSFFQVILAGLFLIFLIYFIRNEHLHMGQIRYTLQEASLSWLFTGFLLCGIYIVLQGLLYVYAFKSIGAHLGLGGAITLFLKRNFISTFLPAGTFTSLAFFEDSLDPYKLSKAQIHYGSFLFVVASMISVVVVAIPALGILLLHHQVRSPDVYAMVSFVAILIIAVATGVSLKKKNGYLYTLISKVSPSLISELNELGNQSFHSRPFIKACLLSIAIELIGVAHLYIAMAALGISPSLEVSFVGYVLMVIILSLSPFLRGLGAIEVSVAYVLTLYGQSALMAAAITLLFRIFEFWIPFVAGIGALLFRQGNLLLRVFPALLLLLLGAVNIISSLTPAIPYRLYLLRDFIPVSVTEFSTIAVLLLGIIMIVCSTFLLTGARNAWKIALTISMLSLVGHLTKAIDYEEALLALLTISILIYTRKAYFVKHDLQFQLRSVEKIAVVLGALFIYAWAGFYLLHTKHLGFDATWGGSFQHAVRSILFITNDLTPFTRMGKYFLISVQTGSAAAIGYILYVTLRPASTVPAEAKDVEAASFLVSRYGRSSIDYFKVYPDKQLFFNEAKTSFLAYAESRHYAIVLENPVAPDPETSFNLLQNFEEYCKERGLRAFYYRVNESDLPAYHALKKKAILIGQEAILDLPEFSLGGANKKSLRNAVHKIEHSGLHLNGYYKPLKEGVIQKLKSVSDDWLHVPGHQEAGFSQGVFLPEAIKNTTVLTVENDEEKILAFTNLIPSYTTGEGTYDLLRYSKEIPNGALDYLMVKMIEYFRDNNYQTLNLGLAPFAGAAGSSVNDQVIRFYRDHFNQAYRFKGLYEYKNKFGPRWENRYLVYDQLYDLVRFPVVLGDVSG